MNIRSQRSDHLIAMAVRSLIYIGMNVLDVCQDLLFGLGIMMICGLEAAGYHRIVQHHTARL